MYFPPKTALALTAQLFHYFEGKLPIRGVLSLNETLPQNDFTPLSAPLEGFPAMRAPAANSPSSAGSVTVPSLTHISPPAPLGIGDYIAFKVLRN